MILGFQGFLSSIIFCLIGYGLIYGSLNNPRRTYTFFLPVYVLLFIYMRRYGFLDWVVPESLLTNVLSTIGLSFLLFKILHVMIEAGSGTLHKFDFLTFLNYCLNFTTFMMGPIQRYDDYYNQWHGEKKQLLIHLRLTLIL
ncbi:MAG: hypothetical protein MRK02_03470 [Candidatus Scalindua sp.]|nr:hypothetical protein [Candidatus Scalindua sp.]